MAKGNLALMVLEKAKQKYGESEEPDTKNVGKSEASKKVLSAFQSGDSDALGNALGEFFDIYSSQSKD